MLVLDQQRFDPGFIDCITHALTSNQILHYLALTWAEDKERVVILWCHTGEAAAKAQSIRVALSKERKRRGEVRTFEIRVSSAWPYTHRGVKGEAIKIWRDRGTKMTRMYAALKQMKEQRGG